MRRREFIAGLGGAAVWPLAARAQQRAVPVIGYLALATMGTAQLFTPAFLRGLGEQGYAEGRNVEILYRWADKYDRLPALATELVRRPVAVIFSAGGSGVALTAKSATSAIPIVFVGGGDPADLGLVASLNRPGGNATGVNILTGQLLPKRLELLHEIVPAATQIGFLVNPTNPAAEIGNKEAETAARTLGVRLVTLNASTPSEIEAVFSTLVERRINCLLVDGAPLWTFQRNQLAVLAARHAVAAIYPVREIVEAGGLVSYGANISDAYRLAGTYVGRILKGEKPSDLPAQQSVRTELVLNLKTAKALGLAIPPNLLALADEVIE
jgi:putative tryptophan/tyrosine transport system substrate-binding protein